MQFESYFQFLSFLLFSMATAIGVPLPFSVPPQPEPPALLRVAPKDSIAFLSWSGALPAEPKSTNQTEQLAAEPEVQAMVAQLRQALLAMLASDQDPEAAVLRRIAEVGTAALQRPGCLFVQRVQHQPRRDLAAGMALQLGDGMQGARAVVAALDLLLSGHLRDRARPDDLDVDGVTFRALPIPNPDAFVGWAEHDGWFLLAIGKDSARQLVAGLRGDAGLQANPVYAQLAPGCAVARPCTRAFVDVPALLAVLSDGGGEVWVALARALGLHDAKGMVAVAGLEGNGFCSRLRVAGPGRSGLLGLFPGKPLSQDELLQIPLDANVALAARLDLGRLDAAAIDLFAAFFGGDVREQYGNRFPPVFQQQTGVRWREDLLQHLGDHLTIWNAPSQGGALFTGATASLRLQDGAAFEQSLQQAMGRIAESAPAKARAGVRLRRGQLYLDQFRWRDRACWWADSFDADFPFALAWTASRQHALLSLMPQPLKATLDAEALPNPDRSLLRLPQLNHRGNAVALCHLDLQGMLTLGYPALLVLLQAAGEEWQREGFDFDVADLPRPAALLPHLGRELTLLEPVDGGWALQRTGTLPVADPLTAGLVVGLTAILADL